MYGAVKEKFGRWDRLKGNTDSIGSPMFLDERPGCESQRGFIYAVVVVARGQKWPISHRRFLARS